MFSRISAHCLLYRHVSINLKKGKWRLISWTKTASAAGAAAASATNDNDDDSDSDDDDDDDNNTRTASAATLMSSTVASTCKTSHLPRPYELFSLLSLDSLPHLSWYPFQPCLLPSQLLSSDWNLTYRSGAPTAGATHAASTGSSDNHDDSDDDDDNDSHSGAAVLDMSKSAGLAVVVLMAVGGLMA